jgi:hypothetical protein
MFRRSLLCLLMAALAPHAEAATSYPKVLPEVYDGIAPFRLVGQLFFKSGSADYLGSGTIIGNRSVLTAGHNIYDGDTGFSTQLEFYRNTRGTRREARQFATRKLLYAGYQAAAGRYGGEDVRSFGRDAAGVQFGTAPWGQQKAAYSSDPDLFRMRHVQLAIGYGAEGAHDGDYPLFVRPSTSFFRVYGAFAENTSIYVEGGMSGGPLVSQRDNGTYAVIGIVVSASRRPIAGGVRMMDGGLTTFIRTYLP